MTLCFHRSHTSIVMLGTVRVLLDGVCSVLRPNTCHGTLGNNTLQAHAKQVPLDSVRSMLQHIGGQGSLHLLMLNSEALVRQRVA